jgi:dephospho-CoA kinase
MTTTALGLTGGIGSGKSSVARLFEKLRVPVVDADAIVHQIQSPGSPVLDEIAEAFGSHLIDSDGALDRAALAEVVFRDPEARQRLGQIVHPRVGVEMARQLEAVRTAGEKLVVVDIPLLFEGAKAGRNTAALLGLDAVLLVWVPPETQLERTMARDGCTREEAQRRLDAQMPIDEKKQLADYVIDNSGPPEQTEKQVRELYEKLTA